MVSILVRRRGQAIKCTPQRGTRLIVLQLFEKQGFLTQYAKRAWCARRGFEMVSEIVSIINRKRSLRA